MADRKTVIYVMDGLILKGVQLEFCEPIEDLCCGDESVEVLTCAEPKDSTLKRIGLYREWSFLFFISTFDFCQEKNNHSLQGKCFNCL